MYVSSAMSDHDTQDGQRPPADSARRTSSRPRASSAKAVLAVADRSTVAKHRNGPKPPTQGGASSSKDTRSNKKKKKTSTATPSDVNIMLMNNPKQRVPAASSGKLHGGRTRCWCHTYFIAADKDGEWTVPVTSDNFEKHNAVQPKTVCKFCLETAQKKAAAENSTAAINVKKFCFSWKPSTLRRDHLLKHCPGFRADDGYNDAAVQKCLQQLRDKDAQAANVRTIRILDLSFLARAVWVWFFNSRVGN